MPSDLQKIIDHWHSLPAEIKQAILTLVKHAHSHTKGTKR
jgi:hypothetical protein